MKLDVSVKTNLKLQQVNSKVQGATVETLKEVILLIANDAVKGSPVLTGHNRRSIQWEARGLTARTFSTSGYGGFLETGTVRMGARPYFKPALDRNIGKFHPILRKRLAAI